MDREAKLSKARESLELALVAFGVDDGIIEDVRAIASLRDAALIQLTEANLDLASALNKLTKTLQRDDGSVPDTLNLSSFRMVYLERLAKHVETDPYTVFTATDLRDQLVFDDLPNPSFIGPYEGTDDYCRSQTRHMERINRDGIQVIGSLTTAGVLSNVETGSSYICLNADTIAHCIQQNWLRPLAPKEINAVAARTSIEANLLKLRVNDPTYVHSISSPSSIELTKLSENRVLLETALRNFSHHLTYSTTLRESTNNFQYLKCLADLSKGDPNATFLKARLEQFDVFAEVDKYPDTDCIGCLKAANLVEDVEGDPSRIKFATRAVIVGREKGWFSNSA